jgi:hypothetical protein
MSSSKAFAVPQEAYTSLKKGNLAHHLWSGVIAGQISGLIMAVVMMAVFTIFLAKGPLYPVQVIGAFIFGDAAIQGFHLPALIAGLLLHQLGPSLFWGVVLGLTSYSLQIQSGPSLGSLCLVLGLLSQIIDVNLIMPFVMTTLHGHNIWAEQVPAFWSWAAHLVFGFGLLVYSKVYLKLEQRFS